MRRFTLPEPEITLYEEGFSDKDILNRKSKGDKLSQLIERIDEPMVIALDGDWGTGKSFFLKCWVGQHLLDTDKKEHKATPVYFDAFANDYTDDPLLALTAEILEVIETRKSTLTKVKDGAIKKFKVVTPALARIMLSAASFGATNLPQVTDAWDEVVKGGNTELAKWTNGIWKQEQGRRAAMRVFREALVELTKDGDKLAIVVDELDRCRPDYALSMLEIIKHFFNVPNVHFILGVNLRALENSVRARYGSGIDAGLYLQKFYQLRFPIMSGDSQLFAQENRKFRTDIYYQYFRSADQGSHQIREIVSHFLKFPTTDTSYNFRGFHRLYTYLSLTPSHLTYLDRVLTAGLLLIKSFRPALFQNIAEGNLDPQKVVDFLGINLEKLNSTDRNFRSVDPQLGLIWRISLGLLDLEDPVAERVKTAFEDGPLRSPQVGSYSLVTEMAKKSVQMFELPN